MKKFIPLILFLFYPNFSYGKKTNLNRVTSEFQENIENKADLDNDIRNYIKNSEQNIGSGSVYEVFSPTEIRISNSDAEEMGRAERLKMEYFNKFEIDYSRPGVKKHQQDIDEIVKLTHSKIGKILEFLRKNGIDCKEFLQKKNEDKPFLTDIEKIPSKEVDYKPHFCEHLESKYNCLSSLSIRCEKKGMKWEEWEAKSIKISGPELLASSGYGFFYAHHVADSVFERKLFSPSSREYKWVRFSSVPAMKHYLADRFKARPESFSDDMTFSWEGGIYHLEGKNYAWRFYNINYKYRDGEEICEKWSDEIWQDYCSFGS